MRKNNNCIRLLYSSTNPSSIFFYSSISTTLTSIFLCVFSPNCIGSLYVPLILSPSSYSFPLGCQCMGTELPSTLQPTHSDFPFLLLLVFLSPLQISVTGRDLVFSRGAQVAVQSAVNPGLLVPHVVPHSL